MVMILRSLSAASGLEWETSRGDPDCLIVFRYFTMSAYGAITSKVTSTQLPTIWKTKLKTRITTSDSTTTPKPTSGSEAWQYVVTYHLTLESASLPSRTGLIEYLHDEFADEIERGLTYPQETLAGERMTKEAFETYFFAADVILGLIASEQSLIELGVEAELMEEGKEKELDIDFDKVRQGRGWAECVAGFYYVSSGDAYDRIVL